MNIRPLVVLWILVASAALAGCGPAPEAPDPSPRVALPPDHTPGFTRSHALASGCDDCHGVDACARCHRTRPPSDHHPGFVGPAHAAAARFAPERCATCHTGGTCGRCHGH